MQVDREINVRNAPAAERGAASQMRDIVDVFRSHHAGVVNRHVHEYAIQINILLRVRIDQIVIVVPGNRQDRLAVQLRIIKSIE